MTGKPDFLRQPLVQSLALSLGIHLALLGLVQPTPHGGTLQTLVINARLDAAAEAAPAPPPEVDALEPPAAAPSPADVPQPALPLMSVPKPAPIQLAEGQSPPQPPPSPPSANVATVEPRDAPPAPAQAGSPPPPAAEENPAPPVLAVPIDTTWYLARQVDRHPKALGSIMPMYPETARQRGQEGTLKLMVKIDDLGRVQDVEVVEAHPSGVFDAAAVEAFRDARFLPAMKDGRPVRYQAYMRVEFKLE